MSPEQVRAPKTVDHRTDVWSLGVCMYELLTNSMPFGGDELQQTFAQILEKDPTPIRALVTGVPEGVEQIVMKCLSKKREGRFGDVGELARALSPFGSGTWIQSSERVVATLVRGVTEDMTSGTRLKKVTGPQSFDSLPIPSSPGGRRFDGELTGTANTVHRRFGGLDGSRRPWLVPVLSATALLGILLGAVGIAVKRSAAVETPPVSASPLTEATPMETVAAPPPGIVTSPVRMAGSENDTAGTPPAGSVLSSTPAPSAPLPTQTSAASAKRTSPAVTSPKAPVYSTQPPTPKKPPTSSKPPALPRRATEVARLI